MCPGVGVQWGGCVQGVCVRQGGVQGDVHLLPIACWDTHPMLNCMMGYTPLPNCIL